MAPLYTQLLYENNAVSSTVLSAAVPAGYIWDVRDIELSTYGPGIAANGNFRIQDTANCNIWQLGWDETYTGSVHHWDGRQVLTAGQKLVFVPDAGTWYVRVTGYLLSAP